MTSDTIKSKTPFKSLTQQDRAAHTARAIAAAVSVAEEHGIQTKTPLVLADRFAIRVHLSPAPLVARVSTFTALLRPPIESWLARELDVTRFLHERGAPVVPPSDLIPPGPYLKDGFAISFWTHVKPVSEELPAPEVVAKMLAELHQVLRDYPGELPLLAPPLNDIPRGLDRIERLGGILPPDEVSMLRKVADRLLPAIRETKALIQPLHGDAHAYNLIPTTRGLLWNDFEDTCKGPIGWDLSTFYDTDGKMRGAYPDAPPASALEIYQQVRLLHGTVWVFALSPELDEWVSHVRGNLDIVRNLA